MRSIQKLLVFTAAFLLSAVVPLTAAAEGEETEQAVTAGVADEVQYSYGLDEEGNAELYNFLLADTYEGAIVIPTEIEGHPVDYVGNACFMNAAGITSVTIPASIIDMGDDVFFGCTGLTEFIVEEGNSYYSVKDGVLFADEDKFLVAYPAGKENTSYTIPDGVDEIAPGAFGFAQKLDEVIIPDGVGFIDSWTFAYSNLKKVDIAGSVYQIDDYAFAYCENLHDVTLHHGVEKIYHAAFLNNSALEQITLPDSLTEIGQYAFCGAGLTCVTIPDSLEDISFCAFGYDSNMAAIPDFTIYGEPYTMAQEYATAVDTENDYQNQFKFVAVVDASIPYELGGGELYEDAEGDTSTAAETVPTDENGEAVSGQADTDSNQVSMTEEIGAGLKDNRRLQLMLGIGGGVLVVLAAVLLIVYAKKPKNKPEGTEADDSAEHTENTEETQTPDEPETTEANETTDEPDSEQEDENE